MRSKHFGRTWSQRYPDGGVTWLYFKVGIGGSIGIFPNVPRSVIVLRYPIRNR